MSISTSTGGGDPWDGTTAEDTEPEQRSTLDELVQRARLLETAVVRDWLEVEDQNPPQVAPDQGPTEEAPAFEPGADHAVPAVVDATIDLADETALAPVPRLAESEAEETVTTAGPRQLNRSFWIAVSVLIVTVAAAGAYWMATQEEELFGARSEVSMAVEGGSSTSDRVLATQVVVAEGRRVLGPVAAEFDIPVDEIEASFAASVVGKSQVLKFTYKNPSPELAVAVMAAITDSYLATVNEPSTGNIESRTFLNGLISEASEQLSEVEAQLRDLPVATPAAPLTQDQIATGERLQARREELRIQLAGYEDRLLDIELIELSAVRARLLTPAFLLDGAVEPQPLQSAAIGGLVGILIASGLILVVSQTRPRR